MFPFKGKNPLAGLWKPKNPHSLEYLKYLYNVLCKNQTVTENNRNLLVETLRLMSEILIWGDQNDSSVFDFFLEKNILSFFLRFMKQKYGRFICVQLLQTLNILFENISNETSVYYLLSNNHINSIICHRFDFSDDEVMAYYISFLKTLSFKLNKHTIHFFYNEHTNDFALYTEAIKFFNHSESMVRIAVRTITLNVYRVDDRAMLRYIRDKTAAPYFINLVWFIGNHILEMNSCVRNDADHNSRGRLDALVAEHLDHLHYLNDILCLNIDCLNDVLVDHLVNRMFIPLYIYSLTKRRKYSEATDRRPHVSSAVSLFLLSQVFLIIHHPPLVRQLADIILNGDLSVCSSEFAASSDVTRREFAAPREPLAQTLDNTRGRPRELEEERRRSAADVDVEPDPEDTSVGDEEGQEGLEWLHRDGRRLRGQALRVPSVLPSGEEEAWLHRWQREEHCETVQVPPLLSVSSSDSSPVVQRRRTRGCRGAESTSPEKSAHTSDTQASGTLSGSMDSLESQHNNVNITDEEKEKLRVNASSGGSPAKEGVESSDTSVESAKAAAREAFSLASRPFLESIVGSLTVEEDDYNALFSLCLLYAIANNKGINAELLDIVMISSKDATKEHYNNLIVEELISIISGSCKHGSRIRLITLHMAIMFLCCLVDTPKRCYLQDSHLAYIEGAKEESTLMLRSYFRSEEIFLDMFEDEYRSMRHSPINVEFLMMDASVLLTPTGTPLTGIDFVKRLPCGDVERARRAIRVFFLIRDLSLSLRKEAEDQLPLTKDDESVRVNDKLDLNNADLIGCTVSRGDEERKERRFLVIDKQQFLLVKPDNRRLGWGIATFAGYLQDVEVVGDKEDSRSLHVTVHRAASSASINSQSSPARSRPLLSARFVFDDHIRCMAAKQRLTKGRSQARQEKMQIIARLLDIPTHVAQSMYTVSSSNPGAGFHLPEFSGARGSAGSRHSSASSRSVRTPRQSGRSSDTSGATGGSSKS